MGEKARSCHMPGDSGWKCARLGARRGSRRGDACAATLAVGLALRLARGPPRLRGLSAGASPVTGIAFSASLPEGLAHVRSRFT